MRKENNVLVIPTIIAVIVTMLSGIYGVINGTASNFKDLLIIFGGLLFLCLGIAYALKFYRELASDFVRGSSKGRVLIALIVLTYVLRALYQISL
ncbi:hypothetical protein [Fusibacter sp. JL216-2]|uniref:hypothetical protein n=1 Tax=Fusibacter sp. JL216-2 TaxID=3071453 RepID=UPI003D32F8B3